MEHQIATYAALCFGLTLQSRPQRHSNGDERCLTRLNMALSQDKWCSGATTPRAAWDFFKEWSVLFLNGLNSHLEKSPQKLKDWNRKALRFLFTLVKADYTSFGDANFFSVTHPSHAHPLDLAPSYNSSCSFNCFPLGSFKKTPHLFCSDGLPAVMQEFPRLACLFASTLSLSLARLYISLSVHIRPCDVLESTIQSHLSFALCFPTIGLFACFSSVGGTEWQIQVRQTSNISFLATVNERSMYVE